MKSESSASKNDSTNFATNLVTRDAAHLSAVEFAFGSVVHALHIPFTGHILSLNQGAFLSHVAIHSMDRRSAALACYEMSGVAASIKSFSPTSKKLGPMLAIIMQGMLFSLGILFCGRNKFGQFIGMMLLSTWAFAHPLLTFLVTFGFSQLPVVARFYSDKLNLDYHVAGYTVLAVILGLYVVKVAFAFVVVQWLNQKDFQKWQVWQMLLVRRSEAIMSRSNKASNMSALKGSLHDLRSPLFLFSFALTWTFLFVQKSTWSEFVWLSLRPVGIAFAIFYMLRWPEFLKICSTVAERFGILKPVHRRLILVRQYWKTAQNSKGML